MGLPSTMNHFFGFVLVNLPKTQDPPLENGNNRSTYLL